MEYNELLDFHTFPLHPPHPSSSSSSSPSSSHSQSLAFESQFFSEMNNVNPFFQTNQNEVYNANIFNFPYQSPLTNNPSTNPNLNLGLNPGSGLGSPAVPSSMSKSLNSMSLPLNEYNGPLTIPNYNLNNNNNNHNNNLNPPSALLGFDNELSSITSNDISPDLKFHSRTVNDSFASNHFNHSRSPKNNNNMNMANMMNMNNPLENHEFNGPNDINHDQGHINHQPHNNHHNYNHLQENGTNTTIHHHSNNTMITYSNTHNNIQYNNNNYSNNPIVSANNVPVNENGVNAISQGYYPNYSNQNNFHSNNQNQSFNPNFNQSLSHSHSQSQSISLSQSPSPSPPIKANIERPEESSFISSESSMVPPLPFKSPSNSNSNSNNSHPQPQPPNHSPSNPQPKNTNNIPPISTQSLCAALNQNIFTSNLNQRTAVSINPVNYHSNNNNTKFPTNSNNLSFANNHQINNSNHNNLNMLNDDNNNNNNVNQNNSNSSSSERHNESEEGLNVLLENEKKFIHVNQKKSVRSLEIPMINKHKKHKLSSSDSLIETSSPPDLSFKIYQLLRAIMPHNSNPSSLLNNCEEIDNKDDGVSLSLCNSHNSFNPDLPLFDDRQMKRIYKFLLQEAQIKERFHYQHSIFGNDGPRRFLEDRTAPWLDDNWNDGKYNRLVASHFIRDGIPKVLFFDANQRFLDQCNIRREDVVGIEVSQELSRLGNVNFLPSENSLKNFVKLQEGVANNVSFMVQVWGEKIRIDAHGHCTIYRDREGNPLFTISYVEAGRSFHYNHINPPEQVLTQQHQLSIPSLTTNSNSHPHSLKIDRSGKWL